MVSKALERSILCRFGSNFEVSLCKMDRIAQRWAVGGLGTLCVIYNCGLSHHFIIQNLDRMHLRVMRIHCSGLDRWSTWFIVLEILM